MKKAKIALFFLALSVILSLFVACGGANSSNTSGEESQSNADITKNDYASSAKLDLGASDTLKIKATVKLYIDGDTIQFYVNKSLVDTGWIKATLIAADAPDSTGRIEEYGKASAKFIEEKLSSAESIYLESETTALNSDDSGESYLLWIWYKPEGEEEYRNLNIEILQNGLASKSSSEGTKYGELCISASNQAKAQKIGIYSGKQDPDFYYSDAIELTLKELNYNAADYKDKRVAFTGVITKNSDNIIYIESFDTETEMYYGIAVCYDSTLDENALDILSIGNKSRIVGKMTFNSDKCVYQITDISYSKTDDPNSIKKISAGNTAAYFPTTAETFINGTVKVVKDGKEDYIPYSALAVFTSVEMEELEVKNIITHDNSDMTLECESNGISVSVKTAVFKNNKNETVTADEYNGKTISVKGFIIFNGSRYVIEVLSAKDITIVR